LVQESESVQESDWELIVASKRESVQAKDSVSASELVQEYESVQESVVTSKRESVQEKDLVAASERALVQESE
jgi:hypothetical protein